MASIPLLGAAASTASPEAAAAAIAADPRAAAAAAFYAGLAALAAKLIPVGHRRRKKGAAEEATAKSEVSLERSSSFRFRRGKIRPITLHSSASHYITFIATLHYTG